MSATEAETAERDDERAVTTVDVKGTGRLYDALPEHRFEYTFDGTTLREFLDAFLEDHDVADLLIAEEPEDAVAHGWAEPPEELPDDFTANPEGDRTRAYARIAVNGHFNEHLDGFDTELEDGDRVALMYPFMFCC
ncbi:MoaD/ThiS family protein (plasmid) [Halobaculum sp. CBA1158]|uniref:MoaD/ThiS family protein n=1 Tax=Halobaculum sp. CBA1158 TaxID=2904243 RepID=UPI001F2057B5|nr:MoaD/ThiS family protein [Halobaculum sp. CBA1158]UIP01431.1 MoaD/ThiS family protein [Halobaculum sp. CBA1158]